MRYDTTSSDTAGYIIDDVTVDDDSWLEFRNNSCYIICDDGSKHYKVYGNGIVEEISRLDYLFGMGLSCIDILRMAMNGEDVGL